MPKRGSIKRKKGDAPAPRALTPVTPLEGRNQNRPNLTLNDGRTVNLNTPTTADIRKAVGGRGNNLLGLRGRVQSANAAGEKVKLGTLTNNRTGKSVSVTNTNEAEEYNQIKQSNKRPTPPGEGASPEARAAFERQNTKFNERRTARNQANREETARKQTSRANAQAERAANPGALTTPSAKQEKLNKRVINEAVKKRRQGVPVKEAHAGLSAAARKESNRLFNQGKKRAKTKAAKTPAPQA